jgi:hypothetical protein
MQVVRRSSTSGGVVDDAINQADWNLDKLDGTGASGVTLDVTKVFIFVVTEYKHCRRFIDFCPFIDHYFV